MNNTEKEDYGWIIPESKSNNTVELGKASSRHMIMMLSFFHEGAEHSQEHKQLWEEMCDAGNNILDDIVVWERNRQEIVTITQGEKSLDIITNSKGFNKSLVKDTVSGNIGLLLCKGGHEVMGSRTMNVVELAPLNSVSSFLFKDGDDIYVMDMENGIDRYILSKESSKKEFIKKEKGPLTAKDITEQDIADLSKEIKSIDEDYIHQIASKYGDDPDKIADKLFDDGHITERAKEVMKAVGLVMDII